MNFKKRINDSWVDTPNYIHKTDTDTFTTLPAVLYPTGTTATVGLKGNTVQNGTPTSTDPIQPSECGERTAQLFDKNNANIYNAYINTSHEWILSESAKTVKIQCEPNTVYTLSVSSTLSIFRIYESSNENIAPTESGVLLTPILRGENKIQYTFTTSSTANVLIFQGSSSDYNMWFNSLMLNSGSTALPYEPYGIKIPISSANTTTSVYLGEVQTTRKIKKLVLTGEETYTADAPYSRFITTFPNAKIEGLRLTQVYCTHFISVYDGRPISEVPNNSIYSSDVSVDRFFIKTTDYTTTAGFKAFLAAQYAAGTPVTVWYVLANEETGIVNEPLMKIGDYADTVSGITIPTITGKDTFDVLTTLKPSEVSLAYTGWHDATAKEWDGSQWD